MQHKFKIHDFEVLAIAIPDKIKRESLGTFCNDIDVKYELCTLVNKPFLNFSANGHVIYNEELPGECEILFLYPNCTEEQAADLVHESKKPFAVKFYNYEKDANTCDSAIESFSSKMNAEMLYLTNPYQEPVLGGAYYNPPFESETIPEGYSGTLEIKKYQQNLKLWQTSQERTSKEWILLKLNSSKPRLKKPIQDQLILFQTAVLAKQKGFNPFKDHDGIEGTNIYVYHARSEEYRLYPIFRLNYDHNSEQLDYVGKEAYDAASQSLLQKWLRDVHKTIVCVDFYNNGEEWEDTRYIVRVGEYKHFATHDSFVKDEFETYEEALEVGLQEALKLI